MNEQKPAGSPFKETAAPKSKLLLILLPLGLGFLGLAIGLCVGAFQFRSAPKMYQSTGLIRIDIKNPPLIDSADDELPEAKDLGTDHASLIATHRTIQQCLETNRLYGLKIFDDVVESKVIKEVLSNLDANVASSDLKNIEITFRCRTPMDAQTVLSCLMATYKDIIENQYGVTTVTDINFMKDASNTFANKIAELSEEKQILQMRLSAIDYGEVVQKHGSRLTAVKDNLVKLSAKAERVQNAISTNDNEAQETMIWILNQAGDLKVDLSAENALEPKVVLTRFSKMISQDIEDARKKLVVETELYQRFVKEQQQHAAIAARLEQLKVETMWTQKQLDGVELGLQQAAQDRRSAGLTFEFLQKATYGEPVGPNLLVLLGAWGLGGTLLGFLSGLFLVFLIRM